MEVLRNLLFILFVGLGVAVLFRQGGPGASDSDSTTRAASREAPERAQAAAISQFDNEMVLEPGRNGQYFVDAEVNGTEVRFLVDTGASHLVLSPTDADRVGLNLSDSDYTLRFQTANGITRGAPVVFEEVRIGDLEVDNVRGSVNEADMGISLLGMTFLKRLNGYQVEDGKLILYW